MTRVLNGWRRIGVVVAATWLIAVAAILTFEFSPVAEGFANGIFVFHAIPAGTSIDGSKVTLPDGKVVKVDAIDPSSGRTLSPWEIDWRKYPEVPKTTEIHWAKLAVVALLVPAAVWLVLELLVAVTCWAVRGFKDQRG